MQVKRKKVSKRCWKKVLLKKDIAAFSMMETVMSLGFLGFVALMVSRHKLQELSISSQAIVKMK